MKTNVRKFLIAAALTSLFCASIFAESAEVIAAKGKVEVCRGDNWIELKVGDKISQSDMISTGFQSSAKIKMGDSILQLGALTRVTIETLASSNSREVVDVYLNTGAVRSKIEHTSDNKKTNYTVRNPIAVASVRGTEFTFSDNGTAQCSAGAISLAPTRYYSPDQLAGGKSVDDVEAPADGESDAGTAATDIAPASPKGSVVVLAGQAALISANGTITTPLQAAINNVTKVAATVSSRSSAENVSTSVSVKESPAVEEATTGSVNVTITFE